MRSELEMLDLILNFARNDERVRAVILNGSRVNPEAPKDFFQDFDAVYFVTDIESFKADPDWIEVFGELMILQLPDDMSDPPPEDGSYGYLMQFRDGNRIDLTLEPLKNLDQREDDSLTLTLLDKDGILPKYPPPNNSSSYPKPPTAKQFFDCTNEFWWVSPYVAKGLWRREITYAKYMLDLFVREQLMKMLDWYVGMETGFNKSPGKMGKYLEKFLAPELWELLLRTYSDADYEHTWQALFAMGDLFRKLAIVVAQHFGFEYPYGDDGRVSAHLRHVHDLPREAKEMY
ncbi:MAG: aminoglycoside adenylyltransferase [Chloroflexi bacterium RBG_13_50_21]|nr:MAG: aminoglycoside adenylyltransferase [Chloroflexi bacterium RBG_13_50_21]OGO60913.1 MAG: aminoglycoside adenylyltransferase [Chloroflexi bacterium RBG_19FT_COMBO_47_9]